MTIKESYEQNYKLFISVINIFVDYANEQGSHNAERYFMHYNKLINKTCKLQNDTRDMLSDEQYYNLIVEMTKIKDQLLLTMSMNKPYKNIYREIKNILLLDEKSK